MSVTKVLLLTASPRSVSTSSAMAEAFLEAMPQNAEIMRFNAYDMNVKPCIACNHCSTHDYCSARDMDEFLAVLKKCDLFVLATPVYNSAMPAPLKTIFDRFQLFYSMRFDQNIKPPIEKHRDAVLFVTSGCEESNGFEIIKNQLEMQFTVMNTSLCEAIYFGGTDSGKELDLSLSLAAAKRFLQQRSH